MTQAPPTYLLMPFFGAILFATSSLAYKKAFEQGARVSQVFLANNLCLVALFLPLLAFDEKPIPWIDLGQPLLAGSAFCAANLLNFKALQAGDVSLVTPLMGTKVLFVALLARLAFGESGGVTHIVAAAMTTAGIFLLGFTDNRAGRWVGAATAYALMSGFTFACCDILMQQWASSFGVLHFLPIMFGWVGLLSAGTAAFTGSITEAPWRRCWRWVGFAAIMMGFQALLIATSISFFRDATGINIVYSLRGLMGIGLVWILGRRVAHLERGSSAPGALWARVLGAVLILAAIVLAVQTTRWNPA